MVAGVPSGMVRGLFGNGSVGLRVSASRCHDVAKVRCCRAVCVGLCRAV